MPDHTILEFAPPRQYIAFLWTVLAWVQAGLFFLWSIPWYRREITDVRSWLAWGIFDVVLLAGTVHATMFRIRVDARGLEYLKWNFRRVRWEWDEVLRLERRGSPLGARYHVHGERGGWGFVSVAVANASSLAEIIVQRADLDDYGEENLSLQSGTRHVWMHPSAADDF